MAFWFGRKSAPEVRPCVPVWLAGEADSGEFVRGYRARLDEVYRRNPVGLRAVRLVAELTGSLPLFAEEGDAKAVELVGAGGLMEQLAAALLLHGNAYVRLAADGHDRPAELFAMRPDRTSVSCGPDGWPAAYVYRGGGQVARIARTDALGRRQVAHLKSLNPGDDLYGLGCLKAACPAASIHRDFSGCRACFAAGAARNGRARATRSESVSACSIRQRLQRSTCLGVQSAGSLASCHMELATQRRCPFSSGWSAGKPCGRRRCAIFKHSATARRSVSAGFAEATADGAGTMGLAIRPIRSRSVTG